MDFSAQDASSPSPKVKSRGRRRPQPMKSHPTHLLSGFEQALLGLFLALDAMPRPGNSFQALGVDLFAAGDAFSKTAFANAGKSPVNHVEQLAVVVALAEKEFLVIGTGSAVGNVLSCLIIGGTAVLLIPDNHLA